MELGLGMERHYTLAEIGRITGIPLEELEQYEREFGDLLPQPHCCPVVPARSVEPRPRQASAVVECGESTRRPRPGSWPRLWQWWAAAVRRVRWGPLLACGARLFLWWKKWWRVFEPA
jgi:hypothetical protein